MTYHTGLTVERWATIAPLQQLLMIGTELKRIDHWLALGDEGETTRALERALELLDLTVATARPGSQRRELCRAREVLRGAVLHVSAREELAQLTRTLIGTL